MSSINVKREKASPRYNAPLTQLSLATTDWDDLSLVVSDSDHLAPQSGISSPRQPSPGLPGQGRTRTRRRHPSPIVSQRRLDFLAAFARKRRREEEMGLRPRSFLTASLKTESPSPLRVSSLEESDISSDKLFKRSPTSSWILPSIELDDQAAHPETPGRTPRTREGTAIPSAQPPVRNVRTRLVQDGRC